LREVLSIGEVKLRISCVSNGTPHCVVFRSDLPKELKEPIGPLISNSPLFPKGINVAVVELKNRGQITAEFWERGAGAVPSSGSGAAAVASVAHLLGLINPDATVEMQGGALSVSIASTGEASIAGAVQDIAEGLFSASFRYLLSSNDRIAVLAKGQGS
jgi:diaminopimelate epimerase